MKWKKFVDFVADGLLVVGGLNWASFAWFNFNFVDKLLFAYPMTKTVVYSLVGLSAFWKILRWTKIIKD